MARWGGTEEVRFRACESSHQGAWTLPRPLPSKTGEGNTASKNKKALSGWFSQLRPSSLFSVNERIKIFRARCGRSSFVLAIAISDHKLKGILAGAARKNLSWSANIRCLGLAWVVAARSLLPSVGRQAQTMVALESPRCRSQTKETTNNRA